MRPSYAGTVLFRRSSCFKGMCRRRAIYTGSLWHTGRETLGSKCDMIKNGCFHELDAAFMMHGSPTTCTDVKCLADQSFRVTFHGKRAHAALAPEQGRSAFDALLVAFNGIEFLREHVPDDVRMHYTVAELPGPANVVPVKSVGKFSLRSFSKEELKGVVSRFKDIIKGAALIAGVDYELEQTSDFYNKIPVLKLNELLMENAKLAGAPRLAPPREKTGSTDFGNVMYEIPGSCIRVAFVPEGTSSHSQEFVDAGKTQAARDCILYGAKSIAGASMDLITKPELMDEVKAEFAENKKSSNKRISKNIILIPVRRTVNKSRMSYRDFRIL